MQNFDVNIVGMFVLTPWSRILEKLVGAQLVKKYILELEGSLPCSPEPESTGPSVTFHSMLDFMMKCCRYLTQTEAGGPPLVDRPRVQFIRSYSRIRRPPQSEA